MKVNIDPLTRVEGHLSIGVDLENGVVVDAQSRGEMFRGFERLVRGRSPLDAQQIMQRLCGICPLEHAIASVLAQDAAYGIQVPDNARILRNLAHVGNLLQNQITHFYILSAIDFIDVNAVLQYQGRDGGMRGLKNWVKGQHESKVYMPAAPMLPRFEGQYATDLDLNLGTLHNYLRALEARRNCETLCAMLTGKMPHCASIVPGGTSQKIDSSLIMNLRNVLQGIIEFVVDAYLPDVIAVAEHFPDYWALGRRQENYLAYGAFDQDANGDERFVPSGAILDGNFENLDIGKITEDNSYAYYEDDQPREPFESTTNPAPKKSKAYSWIKAPRYGSAVIEVGPLARLMIASAAGGKNPANTALNDTLKKLGKTHTDMNSCLGRHIARALESAILAQEAMHWIDQLHPDAPIYTKHTIPKTGQGIGLTEAARGSLGHWLTLKDHKVDVYQCVVPTTWNCSPKDHLGNNGAAKEALIGTPIQDPNNPIEAVRIIRAFDPCLACSVH